MGHIIGFYSLLAGMVLNVLACAWIGHMLWHQKTAGIQRIPWVQGVITVLILIPSVILAAALLGHDFSYVLVVDYTDSLLPWAYSLTAFWAGQEGSFLFWTLVVALFGLFWAGSSTARNMANANKCSFWLVYCLIQAFFLLIVTTVSNPLLQIARPPVDGNGLNPLLQHPGMVFHPPLLFIGYAGLAVPAAAALGTVFVSDDAWLDKVRNWTLVAWTFLTAGIVLGAWWSYMELGWGGYWAWDPVENASLIPWLAGSAFIHTAVVGRKGRSLGRTNVILAGLALVCCFLATFVTRSGMLDSLHAFGAQGVGMPLIWAMALGLLFAIISALGTRTSIRRELPFIASQQGGIVFITWLLLILAVVIALGTLWPLLSKIWTDQSVGFGPDFYNRVCLPFFTLLLVVLALCPWMGWTTWRRYPKALAAVLGSAVFCGVLLWALGIRDILPLIASAFALTCVLALLGVSVYRPGYQNSRVKLAVMGVHIGLAVLALGIAISGPYKQEMDVVMTPGEELQLGTYTFTYLSLEREAGQRMEAYKAKLEVEKDGRNLGHMLPERRFYRNFRQPFAEAAVISGLGDELYATLLGFNQEGQVRIQIRINPGVNWIWIGGILMCLAGLLAIRRKSTKNQTQSTEENIDLSLQPE